MLQEGVRTAILSQDEAGLIRIAQTAHQAVIRVDDFPPDLS